MNHTEASQRAMQRVMDGLRQRLSRLSRASRRIAGDLDLDTVLPEQVAGITPSVE